MSQAFSVTFWGVRGSIASPGPTTQRYGGNTPCLEINCGDRTIIIDAGTGLRPLGGKMAAAGPNQEIDIFLTHTHMDHFVGLPFFAPAYHPSNIVRFWAAHLRPERTLESACRHLMSNPLFPVPPDVFQAVVSFIDFDCGTTLTPTADIKIETAPLDHPGRATGYRVEYGGKVISVITDTAHVPGKPNESAMRLMRDADIVIYDAMFTEAEFAERPDWGHSTWNEGARLADMVGAKQLVIFHHDPARTDEQVDEILAEAVAARPGTIAAREGETLTP
ncbi:MAG: MBL fold metallo-hydrolase [Alphaproteobacteria bacterium]